MSYFPSPLPEQSSTQEIGEEAEEDAIFTITLRKVQLHQSASKGQRWLGVDTDSALSLYETCKVRTIKAGTLERLVEYMVTAFRGKDSTYVTIFLCTYRSFATTKQVLDLLLNRYSDSKPGRRRRGRLKPRSKCFYLFTVWLKNITCNTKQKKLNLVFLFCFF